MLRESAAPLSRHGDLVNRFMIPGTDIVNVKGEEHDFVNMPERPARRKTTSSRDVPPSSSAVQLNELM
jgi:hypothetical protein